MCIYRNFNLLQIKDDNFKNIPQSICDCCSHKLKSCHAFIKQARDANEYLWTLSRRMQIEVVAKSDCLQETEIDIQTCLEIKLESEDNTDANCGASTCSSLTKNKADIDDNDISLHKQMESTQTPEDIEEYGLTNTINDRN